MVRTAELLLEKGYEVHGIKRRTSNFNTDRVDHIYQDPQVDNRRFNLHYGDLTDTSNLVRLLSDINPDEVYNLGAQSHVAVSFESPEYTDVDGIGALRLLEGIRFLGMEKSCRFYQASTSELYGLVQEAPRKRRRRFIPSAHTRLLSSTRTGSRSTIASLTACMPATVSSSTTSRSAGARRS